MPKNKKQSVPNKYAMAVLDTQQYYEDFFAPGKITFVPSVHQIKHHDEIKDFFISKCSSAVVFVINGTHKKIFYKKKMELCATTIFLWITKWLNFRKRCSVF